MMALYMVSQSAKHERDIGGQVREKILTHARDRSKKNGFLVLALIGGSGAPVHALSKMNSGRQSYAGQSDALFQNQI